MYMLYLTLHLNYEVGSKVIKSKRCFVADVVKALAFYRFLISSAAISLPANWRTFLIMAQKTARICMPALGPRKFN